MQGKHRFPLACAAGQLSAPLLFVYAKKKLSCDTAQILTHFQLPTCDAKAPRIDIFFCIATKKRSIFCSSKRIDGQDHPLQHSFVKCRLLKILSFIENVLNIFFQRFSFNFFRHSNAIYHFRPVENAVPCAKRMSKIMNLR